MSLQKVTVVIPCYNEAKSIAKVIKGFDQNKLLHHGYDLEVLVIDNNSKDKTAQVAKAAGARVITENKQGKGNAMRTGFRSVSDDTDYVVMLDGDDTYNPKEVMRMLEPLQSGFSDVVIGSRLGGKMVAGSMTGFNRMGNWIFSHIVRYFYRANVTDVLTGYFAWKKEVIDDLHPHLVSKGFAIEMEMITKMARMGHEIYSVPISYHPRGGQTNLHPIYDGIRILSMFFRNTTWRPVFGLVGDASTDASLKRMKIVFVSDAVYPYNKGGKEKRLYELSTRLAKLGHDVHIYTMHWWGSPQRVRREHGVQLHAISRYHNMYHGDRRSIKEGVLFALSCLKLMFVEFDALDVDHMPFFPVLTAWLACIVTFRRKKFYGTWHEALSKQDWKAYMGKGGYIAAMIERISTKLPYRIIAASQQTMRQLEAYHKRATGVEYVANGIDTELLNSVKPADVECDILYVGRFVKDKNVDKLIRAVGVISKMRTDVKCLIIGHGVEKTNLEKLVEELGLSNNVTIMEPLAEASEVYAYMKAAKVFVLPSAREGFGIVALEAIGCGTPVVTVDTPANAAKDLIIEGKTGSVVRLTSRELAKAMTHWMDIEATSISEHVAEYGWDNLASQQAEVYGS